MKRMAMVVLGAALLAVVWYFASPLVIDKTVDEALPVGSAAPLLSDGRLDMPRVMGMSPMERERMRDSLMTAAANSPAQTIGESMPSGAPVKISQGHFSDADAIHKGSGVATTYQLADGSHLVRLEDFRTTNGPALVVYLAKHPAPGSADDVVDAGFVKLGKLKGNVGNQNYAVPPGVDRREFGSVVIWCELFGVLFSPAPLVAIQTVML